MKVKLVIGAALIMAAGALQAVHITVKGRCTLARAIVSANNDASRFCTPGRGPDTIGFPAKQVIVLIKGSIFRGKTGLPLIRSAIAINGKGSVIRRALGAPALDLFNVARSGRSTL